MDSKLINLSLNYHTILDKKGYQFHMPQPNYHVEFNIFPLYSAEINSGTTKNDLQSPCQHAEGCLPSSRGFWKVIP